MFKSELMPPSETLEASVIDYFNRQFRDLEASFNEVNFGGLPVLYVAPQKPREGMFVNADGTTWNPGAGAGIYTYHSATWKKVHA